MSKEAVQKNRGNSNVILALVIKLVMTGVIAWIAAGLIDGNTWRAIVTLAVVATLVNYVIGDLLVLKAAGHIVAALVNGILGAGVYWLLMKGVLLQAMKTSTTGLLVFGVLIAIGEYFFHLWLVRTEKVAP